MGWIILSVVIYLYALIVKILSFSILLSVISGLFFGTKKLLGRVETEAEFRFMRTYLKIYRKALIILLPLFLFGTFCIVLPLNWFDQQSGGSIYSFWGALLACIAIGIAWARTIKLSTQPASRPDAQSGNYSVWAKYGLITAVLYAIALYGPTGKILLSRFF